MHIRFARFRIAQLATLVWLTCGLPGLARAAPAAGLPERAVPEPKLSAWDQGTPRLFVAGYADAGIVFARPAVELGYGMPHWKWFGAEAYAITTNSFFAGYAGTRASLPFLDFTMGIRDTWSYVRAFLAPKDGYDGDTLDRSADGHSHARYLTLDYELSGVVPLLHGYVIWDLLASRVLDAPPNVYIFEEALRAVIRAPFLADFRGGYVLALGKDERVKLGVLSETLVTPERYPPVVRLGPIADVTVTAHAEVLFVLANVIYGPDSLGLWDGTYAFAGLRYRWATGEQSPHFP